VGLLAGGTAWMLPREAARPATIKVANVELEPRARPRRRERSLLTRA
jgi:hypothetical protein